MQPNNLPSSRQFSQAAMMFMFQSNPEQSRQSSQMQSKRSAFANSIRQQKRENYRRNVRAIHFNFLSSIGIVNQANFFQTMGFVMEQEEAITVEKFHIDSRDYEEMLFIEWEKCFELTETYRFREFEMEQNPVNFWIKLEQKMRSFVKKQQLLVKEQISWQDIQSDLQFLVQVLSKEIYFDRIQWVAQRLILPENFGTIEAWIYKIFTILGDDYKKFEKITQLSSVLVNLLIHFELKIEKETLLEQKQNVIKYDTPTGKRWQRKELFQKVMTLPIMWRKWSHFQYSMMIEVCIYSLIKISELIREKLDRLLDTKSQDDHSELLEQIFDLIYCYYVLLGTAVNKECKWKVMDYQDEIQIQLMKLAALNAQQFISMVSTAYIWLQMESNSLGTVSQMILMTLDHLLFIDREIERIFLCFTDTEKETSCIPDHLNKQFVQQYKKHIMYTDNRLNNKLHFMVITIEKSIEDVENALQNFQSYFISNKLKFYNQLIKWTCLNIQTDLSLIKEKPNMFKKLENKNNYQQFSGQVKRKIAMKIFLRLNTSLVKKPLIRLIYDQVQEIDSLKHLGEVLAKSEYHKNKSTYELLTFVKHLFLSFEKESKNFEEISDIHPKTEDIQRLEANIICQIHLISEILNYVSFADQKSIWKYAFLMPQMTKYAKDIKNKKSLIEDIEFIFSKLNKAQCGNIKIFKIKEELGFLCENIAYYVFPLQSHFKEFQPENKEASIQNSLQFIKIMKTESNQNHQLHFLDNQDLSYIFSGEFLDSQTDIFLEMVSKLLEEKIVESILSGIKITRILLLNSPTVEVFKYFENFIRSSTKIYLKIKEICQTHQHEKVTEKALECIEDIQEGETSFFGDQENQEEKDVQI